MYVCLVCCRNVCTAKVDTDIEASIHIHIKIDRHRVYRHCALDSVAIDTVNIDFLNPLCGCRG